MSRSALWRQEGNVKERERQAEELFQQAVEEGRNNRAKNLVPMWGPDDSFHFNPMLLRNIIKSSYFQKCCRDITDWNTLVDEVYYQVNHLEPWAVEKQMKLLLDHADSPYIRAIGFLFLRYAGDPKVVYQWIEPYLYDEEPIQVDAGASKHGEKSTETIGDFVRRLFTERNFYGTILPRLPIHIEREIHVKLLKAEKIEQRAKKHAADPQKMKHFKTLGSKVMALYGDEENPTQWYEAVIDRVITINEETREPLRNPKFVVTFPEYGNTETVTLGELEMPGSVTEMNNNSPGRGAVDMDRGRGHYDGNGQRTPHGNPERDRGYSWDESRGYNSSRNDRGYHTNRGYDRDNRSENHHRDRRDEQWGRGVRVGHTQPKAALQSENDLYEEVRRRERETVTSSSRNAISRRPPSTKASLAAASYDGVSRSRSPTGPQVYEERRAHSRSPQPPQPTIEIASAPKRRTAEELAAIQEKKRKLMARYG